MPGPQKIKTNTKEESRSVRNIATNNFAVSVLATTQTEHSATSRSSSSLVQFARPVELLIPWTAAKKPNELATTFNNQPKHHHAECNEKNRT
jgi:Golgi nucleoside diphosphatase